MSCAERLLKDLLVRINVPNVPKPSIVWTYFGHLYSHADELSDCDHFYCRLCFDRTKADEPNATLSSIRKRIAMYSLSSSTGNMRHHLLANHQIMEPHQTKTTNEHVQSMFSRDRYKTVMSHSKERLGHQLTLMCCRDLLPFSIVENDGK